MKIVLVRHGESQTNSGEIPHGSIGDYKVELTEKGIVQAREAGKSLTRNFFSFNDAIIYTSPYYRARQTCRNMMMGAKSQVHESKIFEDPRLRELDYGYNDVEAQEAMRKEHGWFYYRFKGGESPADCYDRCCTFLESLMREASRRENTYLKKKPNCLIVTHGLTIRCFVARFLHMKVEEFENLANPHNCDIITIAKATELDDPQFVNGEWGVKGLRFRKSDKEMSALV